MSRHIRLVAFITAIIAAGAALACRDAWFVVQAGNFGPGSVTVSGRLDDPHGLRTTDTVVSMSRQNETGASGIHLRVDRDGSFVTPPLPSGFYSLEVIRTPYSATHPATPIGLGWVDVGTANVTGLVLPVRRDTELVGTYRIASDSPNPTWPKMIHAQAPLVIDGKEVWWGTPVAHGAQGGRFFLRNAYGPRVLRVGYTPADGSSAAPARVLLDGRDITDEPTDFSEHEGGDLEVVITDRPARVSGMVMHGPGSPARGALVVMFSADPRKRFGWASTSRVATTNDAGVFSIAALPGSYLIQTAPRGMDATAALREIPTLGRDAIAVELGQNGTQRVMLTLTR